MSVYKRPGAETYSFDFWCNGHRVSGESGQTDKRQAIRVQELERAKVKAAARSASTAGGEMTFAEAAGRYMLEVGEFHKNAFSTLAALEWLEAAIGKRTPLSRIDDNLVAALVARRRNEFRKVGNKSTPKRLVGPATVNRTMVEPLRKVMRRAVKAWKVKVGEVDWRLHMLAEPKERVREASIGEEAAIMAELPIGYAEAARFAFLNGCRKMEVVGLTWSRVDFFGRQFTVLGKGSKLRTIPMSQDTFDLLWAQRGHHDASVFTYAARRTDKRKRIGRGLRYPITIAGLTTAMRRAVDRSGVQDFHFHDTRHTAATRVLRKSNMKVVQNLLGHERITTTERYAHAMHDDVRAALDAASPTKNPTAVGQPLANGLVDKKDSA